MKSDIPTVSEEDVNLIYADLDLDEEGLTQEEIIRRKTRIFVGGLKFASEDHVLVDYFSHFGDIKEAVVIRDRKTGLSKGYGFVTMHQQENSLKAIVDKSPKLDGRRCNVNLAYIGQKKKPPKKAEIYHSPPNVYAPNGFLVSPTLVTHPNGQQYFFGMPPSPIYYPEPMCDAQQQQALYAIPSPLSPHMAPYYQPVILPQPLPPGYSEYPPPPPPSFTTIIDAHHNLPPPPLPNEPLHHHSPKPQVCDGTSSNPIIITSAPVMTSHVVPFAVPMSPYEPTPPPLLKKSTHQLVQESSPKFNKTLTKVIRPSTSVAFESQTSPAVEQISPPQPQQHNGNGAVIFQKNGGRPPFVIGGSYTSKPLHQVDVTMTQPRAIEFL